MGVQEWSFLDEEGLSSRVSLLATPGRGSRLQTRAELQSQIGLHFAFRSDISSVHIQVTFSGPLFFAPAIHLQSSHTTSDLIAKMAEVPDAGTAPMDVDPAASIGEKITIVSIASGRWGSPSIISSRSYRLFPIRHISYLDTLLISRPQHSA